MNATNIKLEQVLGRGTRILIPHFKNAEVGDKVQSLQFGVGKIIKIEEHSDCPIVVHFEYCDIYQSYSLTGVASRNKNSTLFWPFNGQFPTEEALNKPVDPYAIHGVTREQIKKYVNAVELITDGSPMQLSWDKDGLPWFTNKLSRKGASAWDKSKGIPCPALSRPAPYDQWQTPIILERDDSNENV